MSVPPIRKNPRGVPGVEKSPDAHAFGPEVRAARRAVDHSTGEAARVRRHRPCSPCHHASRGPPDRSDAPTDRPRPVPPIVAADGTDGRSILVSDHFAPRTGIGGTDLRRTLADAKQALAPGSQASHGPPVLSTCGFRHTHNQENPRPTDPFPAGPLSGTNIERGAGSSKPSTRTKLGKVARRWSPFRPRDGGTMVSTCWILRTTGHLGNPTPSSAAPGTPNIRSIKRRTGRQEQDDHDSISSESKREGFRLYRGPRPLSTPSL